MLTSAAGKPWNGSDKSGIDPASIPASGIDPVKEEKSGPFPLTGPNNSPDCIDVFK
jgi:hypothetical protein